MVGIVQHVFSNTIGNFTGSVTVFGSNGSTKTAAATDLVRPQDWNSTHNVTINIGGNTASNNTVGGTNIALHGGSNVTLIGDTAASKIVFSANNTTQSVYAPIPIGNNTVFSALGQNSLYLAPMYPANFVQGSILNVPLSFGGTSATGSRVYAVSLSGALYAQDVGGNSTQITSVSSYTASFKASRTSNSASFSIGVGGQTFSTSGTSGLTQAVLVQVPFSATLSAGSTYFMGVAYSTASTNSNSALSLGVFGMSNLASTWGFMNTGGLTQSNASVVLEYDGMLYTSTSGAWPGTIPYNSLQRAPSGYIQYVELINQVIS